ncbi:MAG: hypothetical protein JWN34_4759 [Bryobacterales bacterium]|jgi:hypothetical protein|nr:hypothetical protein [Bryobacterales bacterium]
MKKSANKTADVALQQVRRLKAKGFYPSAELEDGKLVNHGEKELARTLFTYSESDAHMTRVIDAP